MNINLTFTINLEESITYSEQYINNSFVSTKNSITIREALLQNIKDFLNENGFDDFDNKHINDFPSIWIKFINIFNGLNFNLKDVLSLKKGNKKIKNLAKGESLKNVAIVVNSNNSKLIYNSLTFYVDIENPLNENSPIKILLKRIEYDNYNLTSKKDLRINLNIYNDYDIEYDRFEANNWREILKEIKDIYDDRDWKDDELKLQKWKEFLNKIRKLYGKENRKLNDINNFIAYFKNKLFLFSNQEMKLDKTYELYDKYTNEVVENFRFKSQKLELDFLRGIQNEIDKNSAIINKYNKEISEFEIRIENSEKKSKLLKNELDKLRVEQDIKRNEIKKISNKNKNQEKELKSKIYQIENQIETIKIQKQNLEKDIDDINTKINNEKTEIQKKENINNHYNIVIKELNENYPYVYSFIGEWDQEINISKIEDVKLEKNLYFNTKNSGIFAKIIRYSNALDNLQQGYYKNPYFYKSIKNPEEISVNIIKEINGKIVEKYKLNKKQIDAVNKAINTNSICFIQGPPGTGKTQTICSIAEWILKNNKNLVMTSSTHEAINNFFDRLDEFNQTNPNIILYKYKFYKKDSKKNDNYDENSLFKSFKSKIINFVLPKNNNDNLVLEKMLDEYNLNHQNQYPNDYKDTLPKSMVELIFDNWENEKLKKKFFISNSNGCLHNPIGFAESMSDNMKNSLNTTLNRSKLNGLFNELISEYIKRFKNINSSLENFNYYFDETIFQEIRNFINKNKKQEEDELIQLFKEINSQYNDTNEDEYEEQFLEYIKENKLLNVIGITTSASNKIELIGKEILLYNEYPIDYMIIDEISKCSTPEIISKAVLAKKCLFVGDYLQLPPSPDLDNDQIINYLKKEEPKSKNVESNRIKNDIANLFKKSFFTIQKDKIVNQNSNRIGPYEFLNESHRFDKNIMDLVNIIYPEEEKLIIPKNYSFNSKEYKLVINNKNLDSSAVLVNLKGITKDFIDIHSLENSNLNQIKNIKDGLDQEEFIQLKDFSKKVNLSNGGVFNQFSAFVTLKIIDQLIQKNKIEKKEIAIITLTRNQKEIIKYYLDCLYKDKKDYIKVDTIDNFQGRESNIVFVDFIRGRNKYRNKKIDTPPKRNVSFLSEKERINVAISRAKQKLFLIGHFDYLKELKDCSYFNKYYLKLYDSENSYIDWGME